MHSNMLDVLGNAFEVAISIFWGSNSCMLQQHQRHNLQQQQQQQQQQEEEEEEEEEEEQQQQQQQHLLAQRTKSEIQWAKWAKWQGSGAGKEPESGCVPKEYCYYQLGCV